MVASRRSTLLSLASAAALSACGTPVLQARSPRHLVTTAPERGLEIWVTADRLGPLGGSLTALTGAVHTALLVVNKQFATIDRFDGMATERESGTINYLALDENSILQVYPNLFSCNSTAINGDARVRTH
jgi:hypothetical protein